MQALGRAADRSGLGYRDKRGQLTHRVRGSRIDARHEIDSSRVDCPEYFGVAP